MTCLDLEIFQGDTKTYRITVTDGSVAIDITGYTVYFSVKQNNTGIIEKVVTSLADPENGIADIVLSSTDTDIEVGQYDYDIRLKDDSDNVYTLSKGILTIKGVVTSI